MNVIYKYKLKIQDEQYFELHSKRMFLGVEQQGDDLYIWVMQDLDTEKVMVCINIYGTGVKFDCNHIIFIKTALLNGMEWHVFECVKAYF